MSLLHAKEFNKKLCTSSSLSALFDFLIKQNLGNITFSTSLGQEDQVLTHHIATQKLPIQIFTLDTGRLFQETYDVLDDTQRKYKKRIHVFAPNTKDVENLVVLKETRQGMRFMYTNCMFRTVRRIPTSSSFYGPLAQPVEHRTFNPQVPSSSLGRPTISLACSYWGVV